jgi:heme-degrading monooxygenase HmoA
MYDSKDSLRNAYGISKFVISKGMHDANMVFITEKFTDLQKVKDFSKSEAVKKASQEGGALGAPEFSFLKIIRLEETPAELKDRVMMMHKVKDFDAWLKGFDAEGKEARAKYGLLDRAIGRGADDPNMVYIVFAVSDMKKASERENSPELKKIMEDAGVIGKPTSYMYTVQEMYP